MKIAFLGNFMVDYCSEVHHAKTLEKLGHNVIKLQEFGFDAVSTSDVLNAALQSDIFIWVHTHGVDIRGGNIAQVLGILRKKKIKTIAYHLDLYMPLKERWNEYRRHIYLNHLDYFFTVDKNMATWLNNNTNTKGIYLPAGVLEDECYALNLPKTHNVIFTGSKNYHQEWPYRKQLIDWLEKTYSNNFTHYGNGGMEQVRGKELNILYASTKVVVGDTLCFNFNYPHYFSDRLFEVIGRGGFMIFPYIKGLDSLFSENELVTYKFNDFDDLKAKIDYFIKNDDEREKIRIAGFDRVKKDHTYTNRWKKILEIVCSE